MRRPRLTPALPLGLIAATLVAILVLGFTETGIERSVKSSLGYEGGGCRPQTNAASPWEPGPPLMRPRDEPRVTAVDGQIYLFGGAVAIKPLEGGGAAVEEIASTTRFDPRTRRYRALAPMPEPGNHIGLAVHEGSVYVLGGFAAAIDEPAKRRFSRYVVAEDRWEELPPLPIGVGAMAVGVIEDRIILAGGWTGQRELSRVDAYDLETGSWSRLADMPTARQHVGAAVLDGKLYVLGGRDGRSDAIDVAERYDPRTDRWETLPPLPKAAGGLESVTIGGTVVTIGGGDDRGGTVTGAVQRFDPRSARWDRLPDLRTPRHGHGATYAAGRMWVFGGSPCAYYAASDLVESLPAPIRTAMRRRRRVTSDGEGGIRTLGRG